MRPEFNPLVSITDNATAQPSRTMRAREIPNWLRTGSHRPLVATIRKTFAKVLAEAGDMKAAKKAVDADKKKLPGLMLGGVFRARGDKNLETYSRILVPDIDNLPAERVGIVYDQLAGDSHCHTVSVSPSGYGVKAVCQTTGTAEQHERSVAAMAKYFRETYGIEIDPACKNLERLCFAPDNASDWNPTAVPFEPLPIESKAERVKIQAAPSIHPSTRTQIAERILGAIEWTNDSAGFCKCPGEHLHTTPNGVKDCMVMLDGVPTIKCFHGSCDGIVGGVNHELRSQIGKAEFVPTRTPQAGQLQTSDADGFDKITADVRGDILGTLADKNTTPGAQRREICGCVIAALNRVGRFYFHADLRDFDSALFFNRFTKRLERLRADAFTSWLSEWLCINRADALFKYVTAAVETEALSGEGTTGILPESFWASRPGAIYISNGDGQAAKITASGVQLVDNGTDSVLFAAGRTLLAWKITAAQDVFQTCGIFRNARCAASHALDLIRLWIYSLPTIPRSKPPLCLAGDIGSGKTRLAKAIAEFFGIPFIAAKVEQSKEDDFWPCVDAGGIYTLDNADTKTPWLPDALANAATDGCSQRRKLYSNSATVTLRPRAWICVTTANPTFASDAGLADRLLLVRMARRDDQETSDAALTDEILANRDAGLSHLAETLCAALADTAPTPAGLNRRHPDFAAFAVRIGRAMNREAEAVAALKHAEADKSAFCLENDPIATALLAYLGTVESFTGTANDLTPHLVEIDPELSAIKPLSPRKIGKRLSAIWPHLQSTLATASKETDRKGFTVFRFKSAEYAEFQKLIP